MPSADSYGHQMNTRTFGQCTHIHNKNQIRIKINRGHHSTVTREPQVLKAVALKTVQKGGSCLPDEKLDLVARQLAVTTGWQCGKEFHGKSEADRRLLAAYH